MSPNQNEDTLTPEAAWDLAERLYGAWNTGGPQAVAREFWDEDLVLHDDPSFPGARVVRGREAVVKHMDGVLEGLGDFKMTVLEALPFSGGAFAGVRITAGA